MSAALSSLGLVPRGEPCPVLERGREYEHNGEYAIELVFRSVATPYSDWSSRIDRFERFFGPNVQVQVQKLDAERRLVALTITSVPENTEATE